MKKFFYLWGPVIVFAGMVFIASSIPFHGKEAPFRLFDKIVHASEYAAFAFLFFRALNGTLRERSFLFLAIVTIVITSAYGISDEFHQSFVPSRNPDMKDLAADVTGALVATTIMYIKGKVFSNR